MSDTASKQKHLVTYKGRRTLRLGLALAVAVGSIALAVYLAFSVGPLSLLSFAAGVVAIWAVRVAREMRFELSMNREMEREFAALTKDLQDENRQTD